MSVIFHLNDEDKYHIYGQIINNADLQIVIMRDFITHMLTKTPPHSKEFGIFKEMLEQYMPDKVKEITQKVSKETKLKLKMVDEQIRKLKNPGKKGGKTSIIKKENLLL